ncbi:DUF1566 domain-containing protein [Undibacterium sp. SXout20W]|uniref:Lcl C-terminal domain-containing protein n=1 Tax=Undibacterium sp. SXout20W TaxID=3413051 RepID=UPI003BF01A87
MAEATIEPIIVTPPSIGAFWPEQGGIYAGVVAGKNSEPDYYLIHSTSDFELTDINWTNAIEAAKKEINGFNGWSLPDRREARLLFINSQGSFDTDEWYWTSEQDAHNTDYAWVQGFDGGSQGYVHKSYEYRARAVRRLLIIK